MTFYCTLNNTASPLKRTTGLTLFKEAGKLQIPFMLKMVVRVTTTRICDLKDEMTFEEGPPK
jgi:hypothetical protein